MKNKTTQVILISKHESRIAFAEKNIKKIDKKLKVLATDNITNAIQYFNKRNSFYIVVLMAGYNYCESYDDDFLRRIIKVNNRTYLDIIIMVVQPFITPILNELNNKSIKDIKSNIPQFKNIDLLELLDSDYNGELSIKFLN